MIAALVVLTELSAIQNCVTTKSLYIANECCYAPDADPFKKQLGEVGDSIDPQGILTFKYKRTSTPNAFFENIINENLRIIEKVPEAFGTLAKVSKIGWQESDPPAGTDPYVMLVESTPAAITSDYFGSYFKFLASGGTPNPEPCGAVQLARGVPSNVTAFLSGDPAAAQTFVSNTASTLPQTLATNLFAAFETLFSAPPPAPDPTSDTCTCATTDSKWLSVPGPVTKPDAAGVSVYSNETVENYDKVKAFWSNPELSKFVDTVIVSGTEPVDGRLKFIEYVVYKKLTPELMTDFFKLSLTKECSAGRNFFLGESAAAAVKLQIRTFGDLLCAPGPEGVALCEQLEIPPDATDAVKRTAAEVGIRSSTVLLDKLVNVDDIVYSAVINALA